MTYGADIFEVGYIHTFIDIGAHGGYVADRVFKSIAPGRIIALEPCMETFEDNLLDTNKNLGGVFECYNIAYGNGETLYYLYKRAKGMRRFVTEKEREYWIPDGSDWSKRFTGKYFPYPIESKTLEDMFQDYNIDFDKPYIIKMDCEGCERFLLENKEDLLYIKNATLFVAEFHFFGSDFDGTPKAESTKPHEFTSWIYDNFFNSHYIVIGNSKKYRIRKDGMSELEKYFSTRRWPYISLYLKKDKVSSLKSREFPFWIGSGEVKDVE